MEEHLLQKVLIFGVFVDQYMRIFDFIDILLALLVTLFRDVQVDALLINTKLISQFLQGFRKMCLHFHLDLEFVGLPI